MPDARPTWTDRFFRRRTKPSFLSTFYGPTPWPAKFKLHEFVVMPDHFHVLLTVDGKTSIERALQLIKGGYSFRRGKELGLTGEIWPPGFSEVRVLDRKSYLAHKKYIDENPVKAGLAKSVGEYPYCSAYFRKKKTSG